MKTFQIFLTAICLMTFVSLVGCNNTATDKKTPKTEESANEEGKTQEGATPEMKTPDAPAEGDAPEGGQAGTNDGNTPPPPPTVESGSAAKEGGADVPKE